jgi:hypothetical protein
VEELRYEALLVRHQPAEVGVVVLQPLDGLIVEDRLDGEHDPDQDDQDDGGGRAAPQQEGPVIRRAMTCTSRRPARLRLWLARSDRGPGFVTVVEERQRGFLAGRLPDGSYLTRDHGARPASFTSSRSGRAGVLADAAKARP